MSKETENNPSETENDVDVSEEIPKPDTKSLWASLREKTSRFFTGELSEQETKMEVDKTAEEKEYDKKILKPELAKALALGMLGLTGTLTGTKIAADLPRYLLQKGIFIPREKEALEQAFASTKDKEDIYEGGDDPLIDRAQRLNERIKNSNFLTGQQKTEMLAKVKEIVKQTGEDLKVLEDRRNQEIADLIEANIQTRVKGTTVVKEAVNTLAVLTGLQSLRGVAYGSVALVERAQKLSRERTEGKRDFEGVGGWAKEMVINGFRETGKGLIISRTDIRGRELSGRERFQNATRAYGTLGRFVGLGALGAREVFTEGGIGEALNKMSDAWDKKSAGDFAVDNFTGNLNRISFGSWNKVFGESPVGVEQADVSAEAPLSEQSVVAESPAGGSATETPAVVDSTSALPAPEGVLETDQAFRLEQIKAEIQGGLIPKVQAGEGHDSFVALALQRAQAPGHVGLKTGNLKEVMDAARRSGIISEDGKFELRLAEAAKGNVAIDIQDHGTGSEIVLRDVNTGAEIPKAEWSKFTYSHNNQTGADVFEPSHSITGDVKISRIDESLKITADRPDIVNEPIVDEIPMENIDLLTPVERSADLGKIEIIKFPGVEATMARLGLVLENNGVQGGSGELRWDQSLVDQVGNKCETVLVRISSATKDTLTIIITNNDGSADTYIFGKSPGSNATEIINHIIDKPPVVSAPLEDIPTEVEADSVFQGSDLIQGEDTRELAEKIQDLIPVERDEELGEINIIKGSGVDELAEKLGLDLSSHGVGAPGESSDVKWDQSYQDPMTGDRFETEDVQINTSGDTLVIKVVTSDGSTETIIYGKPQGSEVAKILSHTIDESPVVLEEPVINPDQALVSPKEIINFGQRILKKSNDLYHSFASEVLNGEYRVEKLPQEELPGFSVNSDNADDKDVGDILAKHGFKFSFRGLVPTSGKGDAIDWDKIFIGADKTIKVDHVGIDARGDDLYIRLYNSDNTVDLVHYSGMKIESIDRLPTNNDLEVLIAKAK
ncbi:MAG: hypothetical protein V1716_01075 [Candidatus Uhrbacteria bacterium]